MKALLRALGAILAICGLVIYFIAGSAQEEMEPNEVKVGYVSIGNFVETDSGQIGGNEEGQESMESVKAFGTFAIIGGAVLLLASFLIRDNYQEYD